MHRRSRVVFVALVLVLAWSPVFAEAPGWVLYTHPDKLMSARFPGTPVEADRKAAGSTGNLRTKVATFIDGDRAFVATANTYPATTKLDVKAALDGALDDMLAGFRGRVVAQRSLTVDGVQGRHVQFTAPGPYDKPLRGVARVFVSANPPRAYVVFAMQMDGKADPDALTFLDSVHLGKKAATRP